MKVRIVAKLNEDWFEFETPHSKLRSILNHLKQVKGSKYVNKLMNKPCKFILQDSTGRLAPIALREEVLLEEFNKFDGLLVIQDIEGSGEAIASSLGSTFATTAAATATTAATTTLTTAGMFLAAGINMAVSVGIQFAIQALSPTPEYNNDPAGNQSYNRVSNLYNGVPLIREQGGVTPMVFGRPYCGGVLLSSGLLTSDVAA